MGNFSHELLDVNGDSGHAYRFRRRGESPFDDEVVGDAKTYLGTMGHMSIMSAIEHSAHGASGVVKVTPELTVQEIEMLNRESGLFAEAA